MALSSYNKWLFSSAVVLLGANVILRLNVLWTPPFPNVLEETQFSLEDSFEKSIQGAYDAMEYLYLAQKGRAYIAPVVEKPLRVIEEHCYCAYCAPKILIRNSESRRNSFSSIRWVSNGNEAFHLFSAYLDARNNSLFYGLSVQMLAVAYGDISNKIVHYCHFTSKNNLTEPKLMFTTRGHIRIIWQRGWDPRNSFYNAYLITCPIPNRWLTTFLTDYTYKRAAITITATKCLPGSEKIEFISLTYSPDAAKLAAEIISPSPANVFNEEKSSLRIGVCVKGMDFLEHEISPRKMAEWLELQYALGADSVTIYLYHVPPKIAKVLQYYARTRKLNAMIIELPGISPNLPIVRHEYIWRNQQQKRRHELIPYNDCFYRYSHSHEFVLIVDTDEIIVPLKADNWSEMITDILRTKTTHMEFSALSAQNVFKFSGMEMNGSLFDSHYRASTIQERGLYGKSFINTKSVASVFNHFALHRLHENVMRTMYIDETVALKLHFKSHCPAEMASQCETMQENTVPDESLQRYKRSVMAIVNNVMKEIDE